MEAIFETFKAAGSRELVADPAALELWAAEKTRADYSVFEAECGRNVVCARLWVNVLKQHPDLTPEQRSVLVKRFASESASGKSVQELEQKNEALRAENSRIKREG